MKRKLLAILLTLVILACAVPAAVTAETAPPASLGAPEHFGVGHYYNDSVYFTFSSPEDLRTYIDKWTVDDPNNHTSFSIHFQVDYKIDNGSWHHTSDWDSPKTVPDGIDDMYFTFQSGKKYNNGDRWSLSSLFPEDEKLKAFAESGWDYLKGHSITFRIRFAESFDYRETYTLSPWSEEYTLSANDKADYNKLMNHAPTLLSAEVKLKKDGEPYFEVKLGKVPGEVQDLNAMSSNTIRTEIWMRKAGDEDFKYIHYEWCTWEYLEIAATDYLGNLTQSYDEAGFEIKTRYALDLRNYKQAGYTGSSGACMEQGQPMGNRFVTNYYSLPASIRNRIALENDDKSYNICDVLEIAAIIGAPVVYDNLHNEMNPCDRNKCDVFWINECKKTWKGDDGIQKIHYSQQDPSKRPGSHSESILFDKFMAFYSSLEQDDIDIMLEVKDKNLSALNCISSLSPEDTR